MRKVKVLAGIMAIMLLVSACGNNKEVTSITKDNANTSSTSTTQKEDNTPSPSTVQTTAPRATPDVSTPTSTKEQSESESSASSLPSKPGLSGIPTREELDKRDEQKENQTGTDNKNDADDPTSTKNDTTSGNKSDTPNPTTPPSTKPTTTTSPTNPTSGHTHKYTTTKVEATCAKGGYTLHKCSCGDSYKDNETNKLGHNYGEWKTTVEPTFDKEGTKISECSRCGDTKTESIPKKQGCAEHTWVVGSKEAIAEYPLRTWGYLHYVCSVCGKTGSTTAAFYKPDYVDTYGEAQRIIAHVNELRASKGLNQLWTDTGSFANLANYRAQQISVNFGHYDWFLNNGSYVTVGENISSGASSGDEFYSNFVNSPSHYSLMVNQDAVGIAVGIYVGDNGIPYCSMLVMVDKDNY